MNTQITRRRAILGGGMVLASPLAMPLAALLRAQEPGESSARKASGAQGNTGSFAPINSDLIRSVLDQTLATWANLRNRSLQDGELASLALTMELFSNHLFETGLHGTIQTLTSGFDSSVIRIVEPPKMDSFVDYSHRFDPTITRQDLLPRLSKITPEQSVTALKTIQTKGPSGMLDDLAGHLRSLSRGSRPHSGRLDEGKVGSFEDAVYHPSHNAAHLEAVQSGSCSCTIWDRLIGPCPPPSWCPTVNDFSWPVLSAAVGALIQVCAQNPASYEFCAALTLEVAALGLTIADILSWSLIAIGLVLLIICT